MQEKKTASSTTQHLGIGASQFIKVAFAQARSATYPLTCRVIHFQAPRLGMQLRSVAEGRLGKFGRMAGRNVVAKKCE